MKKSYKELLPQITTFIFDVDGVFTNGDVLLMGHDNVRIINSRDGYAVQHASKMGYRILVISGGSSEQIKIVLLELGAKEVFLKCANKVTAYESLQKKYGFKDSEVLYMGDDIPDYRVMERVGVSTCPQDAAIEIKALAMYQSPFNGGRHCVRDVIEQTLRVQGNWFNDEAHHW
jgi:3-deoxy-D-manno-octulosonate 8-phosphate phosphatase (KDO 8-P phosphatase)